MSYVKKNLISGEEILYQASTHWFILIPSFFYGILGIFSLVFLALTAFLSLPITLFFFILSFGLYALYQNAASTEDQLLRTGNLATDVIANELPLPIEGSAAAVTEDAPVEAVPVPEVPVASGNSSK